MTRKSTFPRRKDNGGAYSQGTALTVEGVLDEAEACLHGRDQWAGRQEYDLAAEYVIRARTLIELLEVDLCGFIGGFAPGQPHKPGLDNRLKWLINHYRKRKNRGSKPA